MQLKAGRPRSGRSRRLVALVGVSAFVMAACGSSDTGSSTTTPAASTPTTAATMSAAPTGATTSAGTSSAPDTSGSEVTGSTEVKALSPYKIGWLGGLESDPYFITMQCGALDEAEKVGVSVDWKGVNAFNNIDQINQNTAALLLAEPDGMVFTATGQNDNYNVKKINDAGVPLVIAQNLPTEGEWYQAFPSSYPADKVEELANMIIEDTGGTGTVGVFVGAPGPAYEPRYLPMIETLNEKAPDLKVLEVQFTNFDTTATAKAVSATIAANPDLSVVYTTSGGEAAGAISAIQTAGKTDDIKLYTFNATPTVVAAMRAGQVQAILTTNPDILGRNVINSMVEQLNGLADGSGTEKGDPETVPSTVGLLTPDNLDDPDMASFLFKESCD